MATIQERRTRAVLHELRLEILERQTNIREQYCNKCPLREQNNLTTCKDCPATPQLAKCGEELLEVSSIIREQYKAEVIELVKEYGFNKTLYKKLELFGSTQEEIAKIFGVSKDTLNKWKRENGLGPTWRIDITVEEYNELSKNGVPDIEIAMKIGVEDHQLSTWKLRNGIKNKKARRKNAKHWLYINGELIAEGTVEEISEKTGLKVSTLRSYRSKKFLKNQQTAKRKIKLVKEGEQ